MAPGRAPPISPSHGAGLVRPGQRQALSDVTESPTMYSCQSGTATGASLKEVPNVLRDTSMSAACEGVELFTRDLFPDKIAQVRNTSQAPGHSRFQAHASPSLVG